MSVSYTAYTKEDGVAYSDGVL